MNGSLASIQMWIQKQEKQENSFTQLRFKIGQEPHYILPKHSQMTTSEPEILSESEFNSSMIVPKFHSPSIAESMGMTTKLFKDKKNQLIEQFTELQHQKQNSQSGLFVFVNILIWLFYLIGSVDFSNQEISGFHVVDFIGNGFALLLVVFTVYAKKQISSFSEILHIWSILLTIVFFSYPIKTSSSPQSDSIFIEVLNILRCLRLIFPFFVWQSPFSLGRKILNVIFKSKKIVSFVLIVCILLGFFFYQIFSDSTGNRCRKNETPLVLNTWNTVDERLCGQRTCPIGSFCRNPKVFDFKLPTHEKVAKGLQSGLYSFDSSWHSAVSIFQMFTLNGWGRISQMYFDVYPGWISVPFFIIGWVMFEKLLMGLVVIFYDMMKQKRQKRHMLTEGGKKKFNQSLEIGYEDIKVEFHDVTISRVQSQRSLVLQKSNCRNEVGAGNEQQVPEQKMGMKMKILLYSLVIVFSIVNIVLASQFGLQPSKIDEDMYNRRVGVVLAVFFILQLILLVLLKYEIIEQGEESQEELIESSSILPQKHHYGMTQKQTTETVLSLESFIFYISFADYILRLIQGKFIIEQRSGLTALAHFVISLRLYYVYLALIDIFNFTSLQSHLVTCVKTFKSVIAYLVVIIVCASVLGAISFNINKNDHSRDEKSTAGVFQLNRFLMFLVNHSWQSLFNFSISQGFVYQESLFVQIVGAICLVIGSMIFMRFLISHLVHQAFWEGLYGKQKCDQQEYIESTKKTKKTIQSFKQHSTTSPAIKTYKDFTIKQEEEEEEEEKMLKNQKSFFIFAFDNCVRELAFSVVKHDSYQQVIKFRFYLVYVVVNLICCIACDSMVYGVISTVLEGFVLVDILLTAIALRFTGKYSYSENKFTNIAHFIFALMVIVFSLTQFQLQLIPFIQVMRIIIILNYFKSFKETFIFVESIYITIFLHFLIMIPILLGFALMMLLVFSSKNQTDSFIFKIGEGFKLSLILFCQKGWDISRIFGTQNLSTLFGQLTIFSMLITWVSFSLSFFYSLAGIMISLMIKVKESSEEEMKKQLFNQSALLEEHKIKQRISKIKPKFNITIYASGGLAKISQNFLFQCAKKVSCLASIVCFLVLNTSLSTNQRIFVYSAHLFFFTAEILIFALESIVYEMNQEHFMRDLLLTIFAIPGAYIGFVNPVQYSTGSYELKVILLLFNAFTAIRFIKIVNYLAVLENIYTFLRDKMSQTLNTFVCLLTFTTAIGFYVYLIFGKQEPIIQCINYAFIGLIGGDFHFSIQNLVERNSLSFTYEIHLLYLSVNLLNIVLKNLFLAFIVYELSDFSKQKMPLASTELNLYNFNKFFHQKKFIQEWMKIDSQGKGFVNYSTIMHKSHRFIGTFSITSLPYKGYLNRVQVFRNLKMPIYQAETTIERQENDKPEIRKEYVITFYDFLFQMAKFAFKEMNSNKLMSKGEYFIKNITFTDQPISIINIGQGDNHKLSNFSKKEGKQGNKFEDINEQWKKKSYDLTKQNLTEKYEEHSEASELNAVLRPTKFTSEQLYFAYRVKNKVYRFLKKVKISNQIKRFKEINRFRQSSV